ncbi:MAG: hypothetical protein ACK4YP_16700 [Myxococcota bacterium]
MADAYIDFFEVAEYGTHFVREGKKLVGASPLVDVAALVARVQKAVDDVDAELGKAGISRSSLRTGRDEVAIAAPAARDTIDRFFHHLAAQPAASGIDVAAFFPGNKLGALARLKPADLRGKADEVLRGFDAPANVPIASLGSWKADIQAKRDDLDAALTGKGSSRGDSIIATAALTAARERFVALYNGVAKHLVRGMLSDLGRANELSLYFLDLQVHEGGPRRNPAPVAP